MSGGLIEPCHIYWVATYCSLMLIWRFASCSSGGYSDRSYKRRRPDAVITTPLDPNPKRGKHGWRMKPAGWLLGQPERRHVRSDDGPGPRGYRPYGPGHRGNRGRGWSCDGLAPFGRQGKKRWWNAHRIVTWNKNLPILKSIWFW